MILELLVDTDDETKTGVGINVALALEGTGAGVFVIVEVSVWTDVSVGEVVGTLTPFLISSLLPG